jgi:peptidoglycan/LPS O-acetylase OafA/YrhL
MHVEGPVTAHRNRAFDLFRILFALLVLWGHSYEMDPTQPQTNVFQRLHLGMDWGAFAVDGFFLLSGYLIVQSWMRDPRLGDYLRKRLLRIVPGYLVAVALSVLVAGAFAPAVPHFFHETFHSARFWTSIALLGGPLAAGGFPGNDNNLINGSLWTITYEFRCYLVVALLGVVGLTRRRSLWLALFLVFFALSLSPAAQAHLSWTKLMLITGKPADMYRLFPAFLLGGCFALYRQEIRFRPVIAVCAAIGLCVLPYITHRTEPWFVLCGGYLLFYLARQHLGIFHRWQRMPDVSYGTYLYGWPVQSFAIWLFHPRYYFSFPVTALICVGLGWLSWHFVERPALQWKTGPRVELPAA